MVDAPLFSPRRLWNAFRLWASFVATGQDKLSLWQFLRWYRRPEAAAKREVEFL